MEVSVMWIELCSWDECKKPVNPDNQKCLVDPDDDEKVIHLGCFYKREEQRRLEEKQEEEDEQE